MARYPNTQCGLQHQRGFSLIEAMFSALILAIALLALAGFHVGAFQDSTLVKSRMVATNLAQEKLDDLRSFTLLRDDPATTGVNECGAGIFCFSEIATDTGGREVSGALTLVVPTGAVVGTFHDSFTRTWTVTCATTETSGSALSFGTTCAASDVAKLVKVKISWVDSKGADQEVVLQSVIYSMDPANGANAAVGPVSGKGPKISYTPNKESVPIDIGGGKSTETSRPLPEVSGGDSRRVTLPSVVYTGSAGSETVVAKEEFATVNCTCNLNSTTATAWTPHRTVWNGSALEQEKGVQVTKVVGQPSDLSNNGTTGQDPLCIECCRDHHDTNATTAQSGTAPGYPTYRPYVAVSEFLSSGDHKHYKADGVLASSTTDVYVEACRMKRVDGYWRVAADWQLIDLATYGCDYFVDTATEACLPTQTASTTKLEAYRTWLKNVLKAFVEYLDTNKAVNTASTTLPTFGITDTVNPLLDIAVSTDDVVFGMGKIKQLITRGIYADTVFKKLSSGTPRAVDTDYVAAVLPVTSNDFTKLQYLPFYDANLTLLANWSPTSTNSGGTVTYGDCSPAPGTIVYNDGSDTTTTPVCVTSQAIITVNDPGVTYYTDYYSRGKLHSKKVGSQLITAKVARGNNGLTSSPSIIGATDSVKQRQVKATIPSAGPTVGINGTIVRGNSGANLANVTISASPATGVSCVFSSPAALSTTSAVSYSCTVPSTWVGTLTFTSSTNYTFKLKDSADTPTSSYTTASITPPVTVADVAVYGQTASIKGIVSTASVPSGNPKPDLATTTISFVGTTNGTCTSVATTANSGEVTARTYSCSVPVGWTGYINVDVNESGLANTTGHTYLSPSSSPCDGTTTGSCNLQSIPAVLSDVDGTVSGASTIVQQQTNVTARR